MPRKNKANKKREPKDTKTLSTPGDNTIINQAILILTNNISSANGNCHRQGVQKILTTYTSTTRYWNNHQLHTRGT